MDASKAKPGAVPVLSGLALDLEGVVATMARASRQMAWAVKLIPVRMGYAVRKMQGAVADAFPSAGEPCGLAQKCRPAGREKPDGGGNHAAKGICRDSSGNLQGRAELCKGDSCPRAAELARRERMEWLAREEIAAGRREVMERVQGVKTKARELREREIGVIERERAVERRERRVARWEQAHGMKPGVPERLSESCPFCGGRNIEIRDWWGHVECQDCGGRVLKGGARAWNRRAVRSRWPEVDGVKDCPFCGKHPRRHPKAAADLQSNYVECKCGGKAPDVATWNRRAEGSAR